MEPRTVELEREVAMPKQGVAKSETQFSLAHILAPLIERRLGYLPEPARTKGTREAVMEDYVEELMRIEREMYGHRPRTPKEGALAADLWNAGLLTNLDDFITYRLADKTPELLRRHNEQVARYGSGVH